MISTFLNVKWIQKVNGDSIWIFLDWPRVFGYSVNMHQICNRASFDEASASGLRRMHPFHTSNKKMKTFLKIKTFGKAKHELRSLSLEKGCVLCTKKIECSNPRWKVAPNSTDISSDEEEENASKVTLNDRKENRLRLRPPLGAASLAFKQDYQILEM